MEGTFVFVVVFCPKQCEPTIEWEGNRQVRTAHTYEVSGRQAGEPEEVFDPQDKTRTASIVSGQK